MAETYTLLMTLSSRPSVAGSVHRTTQARRPGERGAQLTTHGAGRGGASEVMPGRLEKRRRSDQPAATAAVGVGAAGCGQRQQLRQHRRRRQAAGTAWWQFEGQQPAPPVDELPHVLPGPTSQLPARCLEQ